MAVRTGAATPELQALGADHAAAVLAFELANRDYFVQSISDRGDQYFDHFAEQHVCLLTDQQAGRALFCVLVDADGGVIGRFNVEFGDDRTARLGYRIGQSVSGRGLATRYVGELCDELARSRRADRLRAATSSANIASQRVLIKSGFILLGAADPTDLGGKSGCWYQRELGTGPARSRTAGPGSPQAASVGTVASSALARTSPVSPAETARRPSQKT